MSLSLLSVTGFSGQKTLLVLFGVGILASLDMVARSKGNRKTHFAFGAILGSFLGVGLIKAGTLILQSGETQSGFALATGVLLLTVLWRLLFGRWEAHTKATVLGTFLFWILFHMLLHEGNQQRLAHLIAIVVAIIPALVWCAIFLPYNRERIAVVCSMFFAGALSTVPILFYDALVKSGARLNFVLFTVEPESFSRSAHALVGESVPGLSIVGTSVLSTLVAFVVVGVIEEGSKLWMFRRTGEQFMASVDDTLQLAILTAIGFAFAENVTSTGYFVNFVREYLLRPGGSDWVGFLGNVTGRSVLTSMVHIVSTGIAGYFVGLAVFAGPLLQEQKARGRSHRLLRQIHRMLGMKEETIFRRQMLALGFVCAVFLHATSNFLVTLPDILPGNPRTLGDLFAAGEGSPLHAVAILLLPTLLYVVGGFVLLTGLFSRQENMKKRGYVIPAEMFVAAETEL